MKNLLKGKVTLVTAEASGMGIGGASALTADYPLDAWNAVWAVNLSGVFYG